MPAITADQMIRALALGVFPMAPTRSSAEINWIEPKLRSIIPLDGFRMSRRFKRTLCSDRFSVTVDRAFMQVVAGCAAPTERRLDSWISPAIEAVCAELHQRGFAHSVECWRNGQLVGGIFGIAIGAAFTLESMFSREPDASKVALAHTIARLRVGGFQLADAQFVSPHLASLGALTIDQAAYRKLLNAALVAGGTSAQTPLKTTGASPVDFFALDRAQSSDSRDLDTSSVGRSVVAALQAERV